MLQYNRIAIRCLIRDIVRQSTTDRPIGKFVRKGGAYLLDSFSKRHKSTPTSSASDLLKTECWVNDFHPEMHYAGPIDMMRALRIATLHMLDWPFDEVLHCILSYDDGSGLDKEPRAFAEQRSGTIGSFNIRYYVDRGERWLAADLEDYELNGIVEFDTGDLKELGFAVGPKPHSRCSRKPA